MADWHDFSKSISLCKNQSVTAYFERRYPKRHFVLYLHTFTNWIIHSIFSYTETLSHIQKFSANFFEAFTCASSEVTLSPNTNYNSSGNSIGSGSFAYYIFGVLASNNAYLASIEVIEEGAPTNSLGIFMKENGTITEFQLSSLPRLSYDFLQHLLLFFALCGIRAKYSCLQTCWQWDTHSWHSQQLYIFAHFHNTSFFL